jgi:hypothetical protein
LDFAFIGLDPSQFVAHAAIAMVSGSNMFGAKCLKFGIKTPSNTLNPTIQAVASSRAATLVLTRGFILVTISICYAEAKTPPEPLGYSAIELPKFG